MILLRRRNKDWDGIEPIQMKESERMQQLIDMQLYYKDELRRASTIPKKYL